MNRQALKKVYKKVAKTYGVSIDEVKREIQAAINAAYISPTFHAKCVPCQGSVPTTDEFLSYCVNRVLLTSQL